MTNARDPVVEALKFFASSRTDANTHAAQEIAKKAIAIEKQRAALVSILRTACGFIPAHLEAISYGKLRKHIEMELSKLDELMKVAV